MNWIDGLQDALAFIEANLTQELTAADIARCAHVSEFHFQRIFAALCGMPLGEYIRCRRLSLAGQELSLGQVRVLDAALRYGYDSPDSFARAFTRFHGVSPSAAKTKGVRLNAFAPLKLRVILEGGTLMEYRMMEKAAFTVYGLKRSFRTENSYAEIPKFWAEVMQDPNAQVCGTFGLCLDADGGRFDYLIADLYQPWKNVPDGYETHTVPAGTWAVFPCRGPLPQTLQSVNTCIWQEWLPACRGYRVAGSYSLEMYAPPAENPEDTYSEIWVPVTKA